MQGRISNLKLSVAMCGDRYMPGWRTIQWGPPQRVILHQTTVFSLSLQVESLAQMVNIIYAKYIEFSSGSSSSNNSTFTSWFSATSRSLDEAFPNGHILPTSNLKIFTFAELKNATGNFGTRVGRGGGFNRVFKGWIDETTYAPSKIGIGMAVAVKILNQESLVGLEQWQVTQFNSIQE
ncbi:hypothetical protein HHK36_032250 [Tetracentron sinense]|uniref:Uncharacterized protein n=1 Tax=Tetracentron sinense TaxID=13715 RepID=A0A834Y7N0_TETSI|nr:hypothetical protein HHK36_032250 [Tetracentron sinense]